MTERSKVSGCKPADKNLRRFESCSCYLKYLKISPKDINENVYQNVYPAAFARRESNRLSLESQNVAAQNGLYLIIFDYIRFSVCTHRIAAVN